MDSPDFADFAVSAGPRLKRVARGLSRNDHDADDLTQECLVRVGVKWRRVRRRGDPYPYARTTLVNLSIDRHRRARRELLTADPVEALSDEPPAVGWLQEALDRLSPRQRAAVVLRYLEDLDVDDIARILGCAPPTVRSHLSHGLARLRDDAPR